eukprot:9487614-Alexandrium_andersonii.AAC.1
MPSVAWPSEVSERKSSSLRWMMGGATSGPAGVGSSPGAAAAGGRLSSPKTPPMAASVATSRAAWSPGSGRRPMPSAIGGGGGNTRGPAGAS